MARTYSSQYTFKKCRARLLYFLVLTTYNSGDRAWARQDMRGWMWDPPLKWQAWTSDYILGNMTQEDQKKWGR